MSRKKLLSSFILMGLLFILPITTNTRSEMPPIHSDLSPNNPIAIIMDYKEVAVDENYLYILNFENELLILNKTDPTNPTIIEEIELTGEIAFEFSEINCLEGPYLLNDAKVFLTQSSEGISIIHDFNFNANSVVIKNSLIPNSNNLIAHRMFIEDNFAFIIGFEDTEDGGNQKSVVSIINCTDINNPNEIHRHYLTSVNDIFDASYEDGFIYVASEFLKDLVWQNGFVIVDITNVTAPSIIGEWIDAGNYYSQICVENKTVFFANRTHLKMIDCTNSSQLEFLDSNTNNYNIQSLFYSNDYLFSLESDSVSYFTIADDQLTRIGIWSTHKREGHGRFLDGCTTTDYIYLVRASEYEDRLLFILNFENPAKPQQEYPTDNAPWTLSDQARIILAYIGIFAGGPLVLIGIIAGVIIFRRKRRKPYS
ncbi:MAG: hypothetical protein GF308_14130 [Candidatus Heimdallarchaeota archaeon]|nr:hypothetical protein [Candidatus Heimdallarchaeota archaeon]